MENAIWNGKFYTATEIANSYELEKNIRKASGRKELRCVDPDCNSPILRYCHGEIKCAFFAHLDNCSCDYAEFDKENTQVMRDVKRTIFENFTSRGFDVQLEVKLLPRHYTHLLFTMPSGKKIAVELGTQRTTANRIDYLSEQYKNIGIDVKWIVISNSQTPVKENETFFIKRYLLNESQRKDILILNWDGTEITQYVVDPNEYLYNGNSLHSTNYPDIYSETSSLSDIVFEDEELSIAGFHSRYQDWLITKRAAFDKKIAQMEEETRRREEYLRQRQAELEKQARKQEGFTQQRLAMLEQASSKYAKQNPIKSKQNLEALATSNTAPPPPKMSYDERRKSILPLMDQVTKQVRDSTGALWIKCEKCGAIETEGEFVSYKFNRGRCRKCNKM
jgi:hypothetical protein